MEYIKGAVPLKKLLGTTNNVFHQDAVASLAIYMQILEALCACEQANIVHRDLSLGNILITSDNKAIKLIDFGCCHIQDGNCVTLTDEAVGTPQYRAPECAGFTVQPITIKSDLYSAGKILWSLITNRRAFDREKPVFNNLALSKVLFEHPMTWHLHNVFANTIRHDSNNRYDSATAALDDAKRIGRLIAKGFLPLEVLVTDVCPICGVGKFAIPNSLYSATLVGSNSLQPGNPDPDLGVELRHLNLGQDVYNSCLCLHCGFIAKSMKSIPHKLLRLRTALE